MNDTIDTMMRYKMMIAVWMKMKEKMYKLQMQVGVVRPLEADVVAESYGGEADEAEVQSLEVAPVLHGRVEKRGQTGDRARGQRQVQHDPVDARLPVLQSRLEKTHPQHDGFRTISTMCIRSKSALYSLRRRPRRRVCPGAICHPWTGC